MHLTVLGSGSSVPHPTRSSSAFLVELSGGKLLLDCGPSAIHRMAQEGLDWPGIDAIWISHFHLDHLGGLAPFLFSIRHAAETAARTKPLTIFGPVGLRALLDAVDRSNDYRLFKQRFPVEVVEVGALVSFEILPDVVAIAVKTAHTSESHAIRICDTDDKTLVFSSDTGLVRELAVLAGDVDLFILECSFFRNKPVKKHLELREAIYLIRKAAPKRAMLTHFYPEWDEVNFEEKVRRLSPRCDVIQAEDGLRLTV